MYYVATLILEYGKMVKTITLRELTPKYCAKYFINASFCIFQSVNSILQAK